MVYTQHRRRELLAAMAGGAALSALGLSTTAWAKDTALPVPASLAEAGKTAVAATGAPLVLLASLPGCPYCEMVRRHYLLPQRNNAGLQAWQLSVTDAATPLAGFDGKPTTAAAQLKEWKATFTPTVLFLGPQGEELAERLVGASSPDFYGFYLEERLAKARAAMLALR